jgi:hypothetical protein
MLWQESNGSVRPPLESKQLIAKFFTGVTLSPFTHRTLASFEHLRKEHANEDNMLKC